MDWGRIITGLYLVVLCVVEYFIQTSHEGSHDLFARVQFGLMGLLVAAVLTGAIALIFGFPRKQSGYVLLAGRPLGRAFVSGRCRGGGARCTG
jgi:hypothetical protein